MLDRLCRTSGIRCIFLERDKNGSSLLPQEVKKHICSNPIRVSPKPLPSDNPESRRENSYV